VLVPTILICGNRWRTQQERYGSTKWDFPDSRLNPEQEFSWQELLHNLKTAISAIPKTPDCAANVRLQ
jgi:hypothetical protein